MGGEATKPGQWPWRKAILGQMVQVQGEPVAGGEITLGEIFEEEQEEEEEKEGESVETLETQACCCWPRTVAPEKRAQDVRGTICFWG